MVALYQPLWPLSLVSIMQLQLEGRIKVCRLYNGTSHTAPTITEVGLAVLLGNVSCVVAHV